MALSAKKRLIHNEKILTKRLNQKPKKPTKKPSIFDCDTPRLKTSSAHKEQISQREADRQTRLSLLPRKKTERRKWLHDYQKPKFSSVKKPKLTSKNVFDIAQKVSHHIKLEQFNSYKGNR